jgi:hypothetical protein
MTELSWLIQEAATASAAAAVVVVVVVVNRLEDWRSIPSWGGYFLQYLMCAERP